MRLTFLGTGAATPSRFRNVTALALQLDQRAGWWLFDCGEGTQQQILRSPLSLARLERVFITHLHGDHLFGLVGLLASRSMQDGPDLPVAIHGPAGTEEYVRASMAASKMRLRYPLTFSAVRPGPVWEDEEHQVEAAGLKHGIECYGYAVREKPRPGRFDPARARDLGVPAGPLFGRLKAGETVTLPDGRTVDGRELVGPPRPGRTVVICGDTYETPAVAALARGADVLVHEATYLEEDRALAARALHSTAAMAASAARAAGAARLILTHISPRYESAADSRLEEILSEARAMFAETEIASDGAAFEIAPKG